MVVLLYQDQQDIYQEFEIAERMNMTHIGSDPRGNDLVLPVEAGVRAKHAVILRSKVNRLLILVNLAGADTQVNGQRVLSLKVLRQKDVIQLGQVALMIWEIRITQLAGNSPYLQQHCLYCTQHFQQGNEVIICPRCSSIFHLPCWLSLTNCARDACNYPVRERVLQVLAPFVKFEEVSPELLRNRAGCHARTRVDQIPFQPYDQIAYCPSPTCRAIYHLQCWLALEQCTQTECGFDNLELLTRVFSTADGAKLQRGSM